MATANPMALTGTTISDNPNSRANLTIDYLKPEKAVRASDRKSTVSTSVSA